MLHLDHRRLAAYGRRLLVLSAAVTGRCLPADCLQEPFRFGPLLRVCDGGDRGINSFAQLGHPFQGVLPVFLWPGRSRRLRHRRRFLFRIVRRFP